MVPEKDEAQLAERYQLRTDEELMHEALLYDEMVPAAQAVIRAEFERRSLEPPMIYDAEPGRPLQLVTIARYRDLSEGIVARAVLEDAGITCFLQDENFVRLDWGYSNFIGGMRLQVDVEDEAGARELLQQDEPERIDVPGDVPFDQPVCPKCGSERVVIHDVGLKPAATVLLLTNFLSALVLWPWMLWRIVTRRVKKAQSDSWHCMNCGCNWVDEGDASPQSS